MNQELTTKNLTRCVGHLKYQVATAGSNHPRAGKQKEPRAKHQKDFKRALQCRNYPQRRGAAQLVRASDEGQGVAGSAHAHAGSSANCRCGKELPPPIRTSAAGGRSQAREADKWEQVLFSPALQSPPCASPWHNLTGSGWQSRNVVCRVAQNRRWVWS